MPTAWVNPRFQDSHGLEKPDGGDVSVGETVELGYIDQSRDDLDGSKTVWEEVSDGLDIIRIGNYEVPSRSYVGRFNFKGSDQQKFVKDLSAESATVCTSPSFSNRVPTYCCWMSRPTT
ncbi:MAG: hypothetical protein CM15mP89_2680 [Gammaproteobacteria bacterium]|nr:MAG: hypothetical protein CM15mP89_2680 [Gammaproteobacteria bacterium]